MRKLSSILVVALLAVILPLILIVMSDDVLVSGWYAKIAYSQLQADAILNGHLWLHTSPLAVNHDFSWGPNVHQTWGLGVPLLHLLFEIPSRILGYPFFPDRLTFVLYYALVITVFYWGLRSILINKTNIRFVTLSTFLITTWVMLQPVIVVLLEGRFSQYEEVIMYMVIWTMMLLGLLFHLIVKPRPWLFLTIVFLAGFTPLIRPTGTFYATSIGLCALLVIWQHNKLTWRLLFAAGILFLIFPAVFLLTNYLRFGHIFEFGQALTISTTVQSIKDINFGFAYLNESFYLAAKEVFGALFFIHNLIATEVPLNFYRDNLNWWQSPITRLREINFYTYQALHLILMLIGLCFLLPKTIFKKKVTAHTENLSVGKYLAIFSSFSFIQMTIFYMHTPALNSRYLVDFYPSIIIATVLGILLILFLLQKVLRTVIFRISTVIVVATISIWWVVGLMQAPEKNLSIYKTVYDTYSIGRAEVKKNIQRYKNYTSPLQIPDQWECNNIGLQFHYANPAVLFGWNYDTNFTIDRTPNCGVDLVTHVFLPSSRCIYFDIKPSNSAFPSPYQVDWIEVKKGRHKLEKVKKTRNDDKFELTFCGDPPSTNTKWEMIRINWIPHKYYTGDINMNSRAPILLEKIGIVSDAN